MANGFKTGGRQKGTPNKCTQQVREGFLNMFSDELESGRFQEALHKLEAKDYVAAMLKLCPYVVPKTDRNNVKAKSEAVNELLEEGVLVEEQVEETEEDAENTIEQITVPDISAEELERIRIKMGWSKQQLHRFVCGERIESVNARK